MIAKETIDLVRQVMYRDDACNYIAPSDLRIMIKEIDEAGEQTNKHLSEILGPTYGGPSLSFENGEFVIYGWADAPVGTEILASGKTIEETIKDFLTNHGTKSQL